MLSFVFIINFVCTGIGSRKVSLVPVANMINYAGGRTIKVNWDRNDGSGTWYCNDGSSSGHYNDGADSWHCNDGSDS